MTLEQLRIFVAVADRQHVTQAARALTLAQSAASHAIAALETRHDTKLFDRVGRRIELTEAGRIFLAEARAVLARAEAAELALSEFGSLKRGTLSIQASQTIAGYWLPRHLVAFQQAYPQIKIRLAIGNTAQVAAAVESGTAELGFVEGVVEERAFRQHAGGAGSTDRRRRAAAPLGRARALNGARPDGRRLGPARARIWYKICLRGRPSASWRKARRVARPVGIAIQRGGPRRRGGGPGRDRQLRLGGRAEH